MKRKIFFATLVLVSVVAMVMASGTANAGNTLGVFCWQLNPFIDIVKVAAEEQGGQFLLYGRWTAAGAYSFAINGSASNDQNVGGIDFQFTSSNWVDTSEFPNSWFFHAKITSGLNGSWKFVRNDGFINNGTFTSVSCPIGSGPTGGSPANQ